MILKKLWKIREKQQIDPKIVELTGSTILAQLLLSRGIDSVSKINDFLNPLKMNITSPYAFSDMEKVVSRIKKAVDNEENITVYGDFDADGITSCAVLYKTLKQIGANVDFYLPDRETESHGLNTKALINIISKKKSKLIITVDCAISDVKEVQFANGFKTDIIITDHHEAPDELPPAFAILNPKAKDALVEDLTVEELESLNYLAGVGVAFKLSCALLESFGDIDFIDEILPLVAVGTVADLVPLLGENRCFVQMGLSHIRASKHLGIDSLLKVAGVSKIDSANSETIAFSIAPRLNASGRLGSAELAFRLLVSDEISVVNDCAAELNEMNSQRQSLCDETYLEAVAMIDSLGESSGSSIILFNEEWHIGIIGIVASKLIEKYNKPVFLMTKDSPDSSVIRCSCRSISGINVYDVLSMHSDCFLGFGGHYMAAGFSFDEKIISFTTFKTRLDASIKEVTIGMDLTPIVNIDMELSPEDVSHGLISEISKMEPFGAQNQPPLFSLTNLRLSQYKMMGQNANHLKMFLMGESSQIFECVKWNYPDFSASIDSLLDIAFYPKINSFNGKTTIQLDVKDIRGDVIDSPSEDNLEKTYKVLDHRQKVDIIDQVADYISTSGKKISLFAESAKTQGRIKSLIGKNCTICNRMNLPELSDQIMFFDCPPNKELLNEIVLAAKAKMIHFMNFEVNSMNTDEFVKTVSGMFKFAVNNRAGIIHVEEVAKALNTTNASVELVFKLFNQFDFFSAEQIEPGKYKISLGESIELKKLKQSDYYSDLDTEIEKIKIFKKNLVNCEIEEIYQLIG